MAGDSKERFDKIGKRIRRGDASSLYCRSFALPCNERDVKFETRHCWAETVCDVHEKNWTHS